MKFLHVLGSHLLGEIFRLFPRKSKICIWQANSTDQTAACDVSNQPIGCQKKQNKNPSKRPTWEFYCNDKTSGPFVNSNLNSKCHI